MNFKKLRNMTATGFIVITASYSGTVSSSESEMSDDQAIPQGGYTFSKQQSLGTTLLSKFTDDESEISDYLIIPEEYLEDRPIDRRSLETAILSSFKKDVLKVYDLSARSKLYPEEIIPTMEPLFRLSSEDESRFDISFTIQTNSDINLKNLHCIASAAPLYDFAMTLKLEDCYNGSMNLGYTEILLIKRAFVYFLSKINKKF